MVGIHLLHTGRHIPLLDTHRRNIREVYTYKQGMGGIYREVYQEVYLREAIPGVYTREVYLREAIPGYIHRVYLREAIIRFKPQGVP